jgi:serine/threonine-protein kinase
MSPEQFEGEWVDARSDLFSAGVVLYRMLTGRQPFVGSPATIRQQILKDTPVRPSEIVSALPSAIDAMVAKALARQPADRFGSAAQWLASLRSLTIAAASTDGDLTIVTPSAALSTGATDGGNPSAPVPASVPAAPLRWTPETLERIERHLAQHIGPLASLLVRRAAAQANDLPALGAQLAAGLPDTARHRFEQAFARLTAGLPDLPMTTSSSRSARVATAAPVVSPVPSAPAPGAPTASAIDQQSIDAVAVKLAVYLGPIAKMIASREATRAANFDEFVQRVEACITDTAQRRRFRHDVDSSS